MAYQDTTTLSDFERQLLPLSTSERLPILRRTVADAGGVVRSFEQLPKAIECELLRQALGLSEVLVPVEIREAN